MKGTKSMNDRLGQFTNQKYISLETFKRSGQGVPTTVWFAEENGVLYVNAPAHTGKVKRIRNFSRVRVVPSDGGGKPKGEWVEGEARFLTGEEAEHADRLIDKKYGFQKKMLELFGKLRRWKYAIIAIKL